jgi:hypothetical protein
VGTDIEVAEVIRANDPPNFPDELATLDVIQEVLGSCCEAYEWLAATHDDL